MGIKEKLLSFLKGKKGNALLLSVAGAIAATFGTYFFVAITALSETNKIRVTHLYNAYQMGLAVQAKIDGADTNSGRLSDPVGFCSTVLDATHNLDPFKNGNFITLQDMLDTEIIAIGNDPTYGSEKVPYNLQLSGGEITHANENGVAIADGAMAGDGCEPVREILLKVNLAGTPNADINSADKPFTTTEAFHYVVMSTDRGGAITVAEDALTATIPNVTSILRGSPQAEGSVQLPVDFIE